MMIKITKPVKIICLLARSLTSNSFLSSSLGWTKHWPPVCGTTVFDCQYYHVLPTVEHRLKHMQAQLVKTCLSDLTPFLTDFLNLRKPGRGVSHVHTVHTSVTSDLTTHAKDNVQMRRRRWWHQCLALDLQRAAPFFPFIISVEKTESSLPTQTDGQREKRIRVKERERRRERVLPQKDSSWGHCCPHICPIRGTKVCEEGSLLNAHQQWHWAQLNKWISLSACIRKQPRYAEEASFHRPHRWNLWENGLLALCFNVNLHDTVSISRSIKPKLTMIWNLVSNSPDFKLQSWPFKVTEGHGIM